MKEERGERKEERGGRKEEREPRSGSTSVDLFVLFVKFVVINSW